MSCQQWGCSPQGVGGGECQVCAVGAAAPPAAAATAAAAPWQVGCAAARPQCLTWFELWRRVAYGGGVWWWCGRGTALPALRAGTSGPQLSCTLTTWLCRHHMQRWRGSGRAARPPGPPVRSRKVRRVCTAWAWVGWLKAAGREQGWATKVLFPFSIGVSTGSARARQGGKRRACMEVWPLSLTLEGDPLKAN